MLSLAIYGSQKLAWTAKHQLMDQQRRGGLSPWMSPGQGTQFQFLVMTVKAMVSTCRSFCGDYFWGMHQGNLGSRAIGVDLIFGSSRLGVDAYEVVLEPAVLVMCGELQINLAMTGHISCAMGGGSCNRKVGIL